MIIETKFNIKDEVFVVLNSKLIKAEVFSIIIETIRDNSIHINYEIIDNKERTYHNNNIGNRLFKQEWLFKSKEELIKSL